MRNDPVSSLAVLLLGLLLPAAGGLGQTTAPLLDVPVHSRAAAMAGAFSAVADDAAAAWWNPAGLEGVLDTDVFFMHQSWFSDSDIEFISAARRLRSLTAGFSLAYLHMLPFELIDDTGRTAGNASVYDVSLLLSLATRMAGFPVGANAKVLYRDIDGSGAVLIGLDLGISRDFSFLKFFKSQFPNATVSLVVKNLASPLLFKSAQVPVPVEIRIGFRCMPIRQNRSSFQFSFDGSTEWGRYSRMPSFSAGMEYSFIQTFFLRSGLQVQDTVRPTVGAGLVFELGGLNLNFDFAYFRKNSQNIFSTALGIRTSMNRSLRIAPLRPPPVRDRAETPGENSVQPDPSKPVVGFLTFANLTARQEYGYLGETIPESVQTMMSRNTNIRLIDRWKLSGLRQEGSSGQASDWQSFGKEGISQIVTGSFVESQKLISVNLKVIDTGTGTVLFGTSVKGSAGKGLFDLIDSISAELKEFYSHR